MNGPCRPFRFGSPLSETRRNEPLDPPPAGGWAGGPVSPPCASEPPPPSDPTSSSVDVQSRSVEGGGRRGLGAVGTPAPVRVPLSHPDDAHGTGEASPTATADRRALRAVPGSASRRWHSQQRGAGSPLARVVPGARGHHSHGSRASRVHPGLGILCPRLQCLHKEFRGEGSSITAQGFSIPSGYLQ